MAKRRIRMRTISAGPGGTYQPGQVREVNREEADELIRQGAAEAIDAGGGRIATRTAPAPETAAARTGADRPAAPPGRFQVEQRGRTGWAVVDTTGEREEETYRTKREAEAAAAEAAEAAAEREPGEDGDDSGDDAA